MNRKQANVSACFVVSTYILFRLFFYAILIFVHVQLVHNTNTFAFVPTHSLRICSKILLKIYDWHVTTYVCRNCVLITRILLNFRSFYFCSNSNSKIIVTFWNYWIKSIWNCKIRILFLIENYFLKLSLQHFK